MTELQVGLIIGGIVLVGCVIYVVIQSMIGKQKAKSGNDKQRIADVVKKTIPNGETYSVVYATYQKIEAPWGARKRTTYYYYYAVAFGADALFVIPLSFADGLISYNQPIQLSPKNIGKLNVKNSEVVVVDEAGQENFTFRVSGSYEIVDKFDHVNLEQKEAAKAFFAYIQTFASKVNA